MLKSGRRICALPLVLTGLLLSNASFAGYPDRHAVEQECRETAEQLHRMIHSKSNDACAGDIVIAAAYIENTGLMLRYQKFDQALVNIKYGQIEMREITTRSWCTHFADAVKPMIATVIRIGGEIEIISRIQDMTRSGQLSNKTILNMKTN